MLGGHYRLGEHLGDDDCAEVYAVTDRRSDETLVACLLRPELALKPGVMDAFCGIARVALETPHPQLPQVREVGSDDTGIPFVVEVSCSGQRFDEMLAGFPDGMPLGAVRVVLAPVIEAVARAHVAGAVHGRLDPRRIVLVGSGTAVTPRIVHCGVVGPAAARDAVYVPPECRSGAPARDPSADAWSLGVLLYRALSGQLPEDRSGRTRVALDELAPHLPPALTAAVEACLHDDPAERLPDAGVLWMRIEGCFQASPTPGSDARRSAVAATPVNALGATMIDLRGAAADRAPDPTPPSGTAPKRQQQDRAAREVADRPGPGSVLRLEPPKPKQSAHTGPPTVPLVFGAPVAAPSTAVAAVAATESAAPASGAVGIAIGRIGGSAEPAVAAAAPAPATSPDDPMPAVFGQVSDAGAPDSSAADHDALPPPISAPVESGMRAAIDEEEDDWPEVSTEPATAHEPPLADEPGSAANGQAAVPAAEAAAPPVSAVAEALPASQEPAATAAPAPVPQRDADGLVSEAAVANALAAAFGPPSGSERATARRDEDEVPEATTSTKKSAEVERGDEGDRAGPDRVRAKRDEARMGREGRAMGDALRGSAAAKPEAAKAGPVRGMTARDAAEAKRKADAVAAAQVARLVALRGKDSDPTWQRWLRLALVLVLLLMFSVAVPMLYEPDMATARKVFGERLSIAGVVLLASTAVALVRVWTMKTGASVLIVKPMTYVFQGFAMCVGVLVFGLLTAGDASAVEGVAGAAGAAGGAGGGGVIGGMFAGAARSALPLFAMLLFLGGTVWGLMSGIQMLNQSLAMALAIWMLSAGSGYASFHAVSKTILEKRPVQVDEEDDEDERGERLAEGDEGSVIDRYLDTFGAGGKGKKPKMGENVVEAAERHTMGASDEDDLKAIEHLRDMRKQNAKSIEELQKTLPGGKVQ